MTKKLIQPLNCLGYHRLPLATNSCKLNLATLNEHSNYSYNRKPYLYSSITKTGFEGGILTICVVLKRGTPAQLVYICINDGALWVTCDAGTDEQFLSRHAYTALYRLIGYGDEDADFKDYDWYDFFEEGKKKSKYLDVICDRAGLTIALKEKYGVFWKPSHLLFTFPAEKAVKKRQSKAFSYPKVKPQKPFGYLLAQPMFAYRHCNHLPMLLPYVGKFNNAGNSLKTFTKVLQRQDAVELEWSETQEQLNSIAFEMATIAWLPFKEKEVALSAPMVVSSAEIANTVMMFELWHKALPLLQGQNHLKHFFTVSRGPISGKPNRRDISNCVLPFDRPELCFTWRDKGAFYELQMKFKVGGTLIALHADYIVFFLRSLEDSAHLYLLNSLQDVAMVQFFYRYNYKISVLKTQLNRDFEGFLMELRAQYKFV